MLERISEIKQQWMKKHPDQELPPHPTNDQLHERWLCLDIPRRKQAILQLSSYVKEHDPIKGLLVLNWHDLPDQVKADLYDWLWLLDDTGLQEKKW